MSDKGQGGDLNSLPVFCEIRPDFGHAVDHDLLAVIVHSRQMEKVEKVVGMRDTCENGGKSRYIHERCCILSKLCSA